MINSQVTAALLGMTMSDYFYSGETASLEAVHYDKFYITTGIRNASQLISLRKNELENFELPINSTLQYAIRDIDTMGISSEDPLLANNGERVLVDYIANYSGPVLGSPIRVQRLINKEIKPFLKSQKKLKWINLNPGLKSNRLIPMVNNFNTLDLSYRYKAGPGIFFQRRHNFYTTVIDILNNDLKTTDRHQFLIFDLPSKIPPISKLNQVVAAWVEGNKKNKDVPLEIRFQKMIDDDGRFIVTQFWTWCSLNPEISIFSKIDKEHLARVNFLFVVNEKFIVLNAAKLLSWMKTDDNPSGIFPHEKMQRVVLRLFMGLQQLNSVVEDIELIDTDAEGDPLNQDPDTLPDGADKDKLINTQRINEEGHHKPTLNVKMELGQGKGDAKLDAFKYKDPVLDLGSGDDVLELLLKEAEEDLAQLETVEAQNDVRELEKSVGYTEYKPEADDHLAIFDRMVEDKAELGVLTAGELRRLKSIARKHEKLLSPFDPSKTLSEFAQVSREELEIKDTRLMDKKPAGLFDESQLNYSLKNFNSDYIDNVMAKDITAAFLHMQKAGVAINDLDVQRTDEYLGSYYTITAQLVPIVGSASTIKVKIPAVNSDGTFVNNNNKYIMGAQRRDLPIRKVSHDEVALTSFQSKMFVKRTDRAQFNFEKWLVKNINLLSLGEESTISDVIYKDVFDRSIDVPIIYSSLARNISSFVFNEVHFNFDISLIDKVLPEHLKSKVGTEKYIPLGWKKDKQADIVYLMDRVTGELIIYQPALKNTIAKTSLITHLGIESLPPVSYAEVGVLARTIPVGILLGHRIGLGNLLKTSKCNYRVIDSKMSRVEKNEKRANPLTEFEVQFEDETLVFSRSDNKACMLFNGFNRVKNVIKKISKYQLDKKDGYVKIFDALDIPLRHEREYDFMFRTWVDHITKDILIEMEEPTDLLLLFLSAIDKLVDDKYKDPNGIEGSALFGYQRIPGMIYSEMFKALRQYNNQPANKNAKVELNPNAVWFSVIQDETVTVMEESNPVHAIKEKEKVVFGGAGGRSGQSMTAKHRAFGKDSIGIISEASVDNGKVGTITYMTADPNIVNLRGIMKPLDDLANAPRTKLQSTAMLLSPGSDMDDDIIKSLYSSKYMKNIY